MSHICHLLHQLHSVEWSAVLLQPSTYGFISHGCLVTLVAMSGQTKVLMMQSPSAQARQMHWQGRYCVKSPTTQGRWLAHEFHDHKVSEIMDNWGHCWLPIVNFFKELHDGEITWYNHANIKFFKTLHCNVNKMACNWWSFISHLLSQARL